MNIFSIFERPKCFFFIFSLSFTVIAAIYCDVPFIGVERENAMVSEFTVIFAIAAICCGILSSGGEP